MKLIVKDTSDEMGALAAAQAAAVVNDAIEKRGNARILLSTGASQFPFFKYFVKEKIDWSKVEMFHLDEYVGIPVTHKASFRGYMRERFVSKTPQPMKAFHEVNGEAADPEAECARLKALVRAAPIDLACIGFGENGHIAFNDPPADFDTNEAYRLVALDDKCRMQQVGEGWFPGLAAVPTHAYSMTVKQIMWSRAIVCTCPDARKVDAVKGCIEGPVTNTCPGSILQMHPDCAFFFDPPAAALLSAR